MATFYFTYGLDERYPYQGGWTEVEAPTLKDACDLFRLVHPWRDPEVPIGNYADVYTEEEFQDTTMWLKGNFRDRCHERVSIMREPRKGVGAHLMKGSQTTFIRLLELLMEMARTNPENILQSDLRVSGSVLLDGGAEALSRALALNSTLYETDADEKGPIWFTIGKFNDVEIIQVDPFDEFCQPPTLEDGV